MVDTSKYMSQAPDPQWGGSAPWGGGDGSEKKAQWTASNPFPYQQYYDQFASSIGFGAPGYSNPAAQNDAIYNHFLANNPDWEPPKSAFQNAYQAASMNGFNPQAYINNASGTTLSEKFQPFTNEYIDGATHKAPNPADPNYGGLGQNAARADASTMSFFDPRRASTYDVKGTYSDVAANDMTAARGNLDPRAVINAEQINTEAIGNGQTATGRALNDYAKLDLDDIDPRATTKGQLEALQADFTDADGNPKIPAWAAGTARNVSKIASFSGMTGSAATAAMSQAIMEASLPIATQDAQFFQTVSLTNLNNKQTSIINKANVLAQMDIANLDARMTAAVENSKSFLQMDLANLSNEQQSRVINNQNRVQSILEDSRQENAKRLFVAESQNDMNKFYDNLNASIGQFNTSQINGMKQFNTSEENGMRRFNSEMENNRQQFYANMQYNIDAANAKWRQTTTMANVDMKFQAAATDVKNMVGLTVEGLNQQWDRADSLLDYIWKSSENEQDRASALIMSKLQADSAMSLANLNNKAAADAATSAGWGKLAGTAFASILGSDAGKGVINSVTDSLFGWL